jgi:hypothetical protein
LKELKEVVTRKVRMLFKEQEEIAVKISRRKK